MGVEKCWNCGGRAVFLDQVSYEEYRIKDSDGIVQMYKCDKCKADIEYCIPYNDI